jgi:hypothetical protein
VAVGARRDTISKRNTGEEAVADEEIEVNGGVVVYEWVGPENGEKVVITPGGRFSKDYGGIHELAHALAVGGKRVLLWDRPKRTSFEAHSLVKGSRLIEPPWPEDAWRHAGAATARGEGSLLDPWVQAAPALLAFMAGTDAGTPYRSR